MWNSQFNKYIFNTGARSYEPPNSGYDLTRLNDIKNYFSVAGYQSGSVGYINANESNFIPPYINLSKGGGGLAMLRKLEKKIFFRHVHCASASLCLFLIAVQDPRIIPGGQI